MRVCSTSGCPTLVDKAGHCDEHRAVRDKARGTRQQRGYGTPHTNRRATWIPKVATGQVECWRCEERINPLHPWDLGHDDRDRTIWRGPEHVSCNRATSGR